MARINVPFVQGQIDLNMQGRTVVANDQRWKGDSSSPSGEGTTNSIAYRVGDIVIHNNVLWIALRDNDNIEPTANNSRDWQIVGDNGIASINDIADVNVGTPESRGFFRRTSDNSEFTTPGTFAFNTTRVISAATIPQDIRDQISDGDPIILAKTTAAGVPINDNMGVQITAEVTVTGFRVGGGEEYYILQAAPPSELFARTDFFQIQQITLAANNPGDLRDGEGLAWHAGSDTWLPHALGGESWRSNSVYALGDLVTYNRVIYQCIVSSSTRGSAPDVAPTEWVTSITSIDDIGDVNVGQAATVSFSNFTEVQTLVFGGPRINVEAASGTTIGLTAVLNSGVSQGYNFPIEVGHRLELIPTGQSSRNDVVVDVIAVDEGNSIATVSQSITVNQLAADTIYEVLRITSPGNTAQYPSESRSVIIDRAYRVRAVDAHTSSFTLVDSGNNVYPVARFPGVENDEVRFINSADSSDIVTATVRSINLATEAVALTGLSGNLTPNALYYIERITRTAAVHHPPDSQDGYALVWDTAEQEWSAKDIGAHSTIAQWRGRIIQGYDSRDSIVRLADGSLSTRIYNVEATRVTESFIRDNAGNLARKNYRGGVLADQQLSRIYTRDTGGNVLSDSWSLSTTQFYTSASLVAGSLDLHFATEDALTFNAITGQLSVTYDDAEETYAYDPATGIMTHTDLRS